MPRIEYARKFKKDLLRLKKSGWSMEPFEEFSCVLMEQWPLPPKYKPHLLHGDKRDIWDIHLRQNWVVFLKKEGQSITLLRTGTHAHLGIG